MKFSVSFNSWLKIDRVEGQVVIESRQFNHLNAIALTIFGLAVFFELIPTLYTTLTDSIPLMLKIMIGFFQLGIALTFPYLALTYWFNVKRVEVSKAHFCSYERPFPLKKRKSYSLVGLTSIDINKIRHGGMGFPVYYTPRFNFANRSSINLGFGFRDISQAHKVRDNLQRYLLS